jgi:neutral ceramidase
VDITPPPGVSLAGNGPEGKRARGYRLRLYARVIVLEDVAGERLGLIVADLPHVSLVLHRLVAARIACATGIGADRLIFSATHTHAGPGNFYAAKQYNRAGSVLPGYDSAGTEFLVARIAGAASEAAASLRPARLASSVTPVWGHTRNRSYDAYLRNRPAPVPSFAPPDQLDPVQKAVDPSWTMIRIDTLAGDGSSRPAAAFSVFAIHGTGNPSENDLLDGDIHALVERSLERAIDAHNDSLDGGRPVPPAFRSRALHLFANGTEGDVSPDWPANARCNLPTLRPLPRSGGPRSPQRWDWTHPADAHVAACLAAARTYVNLVGDALGDSAQAIFRRLEGKGTGSVRISRAFTTLQLTRDWKALGLCDKPAIGTSTAAGADDGVTRFAGWRFAGLLNIGLEEGGRAVKRNPKGCQREKNTLLAAALGPHDLPEVAQLMVVRIGDLILGVLPVEPTTEAGAQMRRAIARAAGGDARHVALIGLANGFMQYIATDQEYSAQTYEGGSTLYGPSSAAVFASAMAELTRQMKAGGWSSPQARVDQVMMYPGSSAKIFPRPPKRRVSHSTFGQPKAACLGDTLVVTWRDARPGAFQVADGPMLEIQDSAPGWTHVAWDDDRYVEVRALRERRTSATWEMRWAVPRFGTYRMVLLARADRPGQYVSNTRPCGRK